MVKKAHKRAKIEDKSQQQEQSKEEIQMDIEEDDDESSISTDVDSDSDSEEIDITEKMATEDTTDLMEMESHLKNNQYDLDMHINYIRKLINCNLKTKAYKGIIAASDIFPFKTEIWLEFLNKLMKDRNYEDDSNLKQIFKRAVNDYLSIDIWKLYLEFENENRKKSIDENAYKEFRKIADIAIYTCGFHYTRGKEIWDYVIKCENEIRENALNEELKKSTSDQIDNHYQNMLRIPMLKIEEVAIDYKKWLSIPENDDLPLDLKIQHEYYKKLSNLRSKYEALIGQSNGKANELLTAYLTYLKLEKEQGDKDLIRTVYERAVEEFPMTHLLWLKYASFFQKNEKSNVISKAIYERSIRNCPWNGQLWSKLLRLYYEDGEEYDKKITDTYLKALTVTMSTIQDYLEVVIAYLNITTNIFLEEKITIEILNNKYSEAFQWMTYYFPEDDIHHGEIIKCWSNTLGRANLTEGGEKIIEIWEQLMTRTSAERNYDLWKMYISILDKFNLIENIRQSYNRAFNIIKDNNTSWQLSIDWIKFEGEHGLPIQYNQVCSKTEKVIDAGMAQGITNAVPEIKNGIQKFMKKCPILHPEDLQLLRKANAFKSKRKKTEVVPNEEMKITEMKMDELNIKESVLEDVKMEETKKKSSKKRSDVNTIFIRNINKNLLFLDEEIREIFDICNDNYQLRHQRSENGYSTGVAFIEFSTEEGYHKALKLDGVVFKNKNLVVRKSDREGHLKEKEKKVKKNFRNKHQMNMDDKFTNRKQVLSELP